MVILAMNYYHKLSPEKLFVAMQSGAFSVRTPARRGHGAFQDTDGRGILESMENVEQGLRHASLLYIDRSVKYEMFKLNVDVLIPIDRL